VIVTEGRAGSEALVTKLDSHPDILCDSEILASKRLWPERLVDGRVRLAGIRGRRAYGFKILTRHILTVQHLPDAADYFRRLEQTGWLIVHLRRRNRLHQAISALRAHRSQFHFEVGHVPAFEPLRVDPAELFPALDFYANAEQEGAEMLRGLKSLGLIYEDDLATPDAQERTVRRVVDALGLKAAPTSTRQTRVNPPSAREMVANYDEVADLLHDTRFAPYLDP
jgi:LPS sulfotransferase NodH